MMFGNEDTESLTQDISITNKQMYLRSTVERQKQDLTDALLEVCVPLPLRRGLKQYTFSDRSVRS